MAGRAGEEIIPRVSTILVAYASKHGSTAEIAEAIAGQLGERGHRADCVEADDAPRSLDGYDAVVLGSAVYMKRWRREARGFLRKHGRALSAMPFWVFSSGPAGEPDEEKAEQAEAWAEPGRTIAKAESLGVREHVVFEGRLPTEPGGPIERAMVENTPPEFQDRRNWDEIRAWADSISAELDS